MAKIIDLTMEDKEVLCLVAKALSSPVRLEILEALNNEGMIIGDIARKLGIPASSAALHVKILEQADLIMMEEQPGTRGSTKLCNRKKDGVHMDLIKKERGVLQLESIEMPVGAYTECKVVPTCGLAGDKGIIEVEDTQYCFYSPRRFEAGILWSAAGYVVYHFPNKVPKDRVIKKLSLCMEICSEAAGYKEDWKSDITLWVNECDCGFFRSAGDLGARRGRLTPFWWPDFSTQHGFLTTWEVSEEGCYVNGKKVSETTVYDLNLMANEAIKVCIGNKENAKYVGGFNLFGKNYGDYMQDIIMNIEYL